MCWPSPIQRGSEGVIDVWQPAQARSPTVFVKRSTRSLAQSAFVDEDDGAAFFAGLFLGQGFCFRRRIAPSSRARVRLVGPWQLRTSCRTMRHACAGWYRMPHSRSIRRATRADVHGPLSYPSASGPRFSARSIRRSSAAPSCDLRPVCPALFSARSPGKRERDLRLSVMDALIRSCQFTLAKGWPED